MSATRPEGRGARGPGSEARRALLATLLGIGLGLVIAVFSKRDGHT